MQVRRILCLFTAAGLSQLAHAEAPISTQALGAAQGVFDFCSRVDPRDDRQYDEQARLLLKGMSDRSVDEARRSEQYEQAKQIIESVLSELPMSDAVEACKGII